jgi:putative endonuclease
MAQKQRLHTGVVFAWRNGVLRSFSEGGPYLDFIYVCKIEDMFYTYILQSTKDRTLYVGSSADISRRLRQHNAGSVQSTKSKRPLILIWYGGFMHKSDSLCFEQYLKTGSGIAFVRKHLV